MGARPQRRPADVRPQCGAPGSAAYGKLFIGTGDGGNFPSNPDPYNQAQNGAAALGKILRIDPLSGQRRPPTASPPTIPSSAGPATLPEIWALGLRHPQNFSFDRGGARRMILTDIGQAQIEEVNLGVQGRQLRLAAARGPLRHRPARRDHALRAAGERRAATASPTRWRSTITTRARRSPAASSTAAPRVPALAGQYLCGDMVNGRIFHVPGRPASRSGTQVTLQELTLRRNGGPSTLMAPGRRRRTAGSTCASARTKVGEIYILTKQDGKIRKLAPA